jgi:PAS domain S-box-containing protein
MAVDLLTLSIALNLANYLQAFALIGLAIANRGRPGLRCWAAAMSLLAIGLTITSFRDVADVPLIINAVSNGMVGACMLLLYHGIERFFGEPGRPYHLLLIGLLFFGANLILAFTDDTPPLRRILFSTFLALSSLLIAIRLLRVSRPDLRVIIVFLTSIFGVNTAFFVLRGLAVASEPTWLYISPAWQTATYLVSIATTSLWTFGLILLVNQTLAVEQRETLEQLEHIFNAQPDAVLLSRLSDGVFVKVNHGFTVISGYTAEEAIGKDALTLNIWYSREDRRRWAEIIQRDGACQSMEFQFRRRTGELRTCLLSSQKLLIQGVPHAISIVHDITHRKQIEAELQRSEARYRLIAENATDVIWLFDPVRMRFPFFSPSIHKLIGYSAAEAQEMSFTDFLTAESAKHIHSALQYMLNHWEGDLTTAPPWVAEIDLIHRDGHVVQAEIITSFVRDEEQRLIVLGVARDITARKQAEVALRIARQQAEAANRAKSAFLANVSHELRTPLHAVLGFAQLLANDNNLTTTQREYLAIINRSGEHLLRLINEVLDLAKIEAGRYTYNAAPLNVRQLIEDVQLLFRNRAEAKQLHLKVTCAGDVPTLIVSDEAKVRQILINLLSNAIKFTDAGSVHLHVTREEQRLLFIVEDTGIGIPPLDQQKLFQPFFQSQQTGKYHSSVGVGLGLSISYELARLIGGDLSVYSEGIGCGARFTLAIPLNTSITTLPTSPVEPEQRRVIRLRDGQPVYRMLVADDQPTNALFLVSLLHRLGFAVQSVADGQAAIEVWRSWQPHIIWIDVRMSQLDGFTVARQIREICAREPGMLRPFIVALSTHVLDDTPKIVIDAGCDHFIAKPFREHDIVQTIEQLLHVEFEYAIPIADQLPTTIVSDNGYHPAWCNALQQAAQEANFRRLQELVQRIERERPADATLLRQWIETFDYQSVLSWVANVTPLQAANPIV